MKKSITKYFAAIMLASGTLSAQFVGGGGTTPTKQDQVALAGPWKNRFYMYAGPSFAMGMWKQDLEPSATITEAYTNNAGFGAKTGFMVEMGNTFYLRKIKLPENMCIGINATYIHFGMNNIDWTPLNTNLSYEHGKYWFIGGKFGAQYSFKIMDNMFADAYFNFCPQAVFLPWTESGYSNYSENYQYDWSAYPNATVAFRKNFGLQFRYSVFTIGADILAGAVNTTLNYSVYNNKTSSGVYNESYQIKFRPTTLTLKLGFTI